MHVFGFVAAKPKRVTCLQNQNDFKLVLEQMFTAADSVQALAEFTSYQNHEGVFGDDLSEGIPRAP